MICPFLYFSSSSLGDGAWGFFCDLEKLCIPRLSYYRVSETDDRVEKGNRYNVTRAMEPEF